MDTQRCLCGGQRTTRGVRALLPLCKFCGLNSGFDGRRLFLLSHLIGPTVDSFLIKS